MDQSDVGKEWIKVNSTMQFWVHPVISEDAISVMSKPYHASDVMTAPQRALSVTLQPSVV